MTRRSSKISRANNPAEIGASAEVEVRNDGRVKAVAIIADEVIRTRVVVMPETEVAAPRADSAAAMVREEPAEAEGKVSSNAASVEGKVREALGEAEANMIADRKNLWNSKASIALI